MCAIWDMIILLRHFFFNASGHESNGGPMQEARVRKVASSETSKKDTRNNIILSGTDPIGCRMRGQVPVEWPPQDSVLYDK